MTPHLAARLDDTQGAQQQLQLAVGVCGRAAGRPCKHLVVALHDVPLRRAGRIQQDCASETEREMELMCKCVYVWVGEIFLHINDEQRPKLQLKELKTNLSHTQLHMRRPSIFFTSVEVGRVTASHGSGIEAGHRHAVLHSARGQIVPEYLV